MNWMYKCRGSISIFLTLVMLPMFVGAGLIIDGARISAAKTYVSGAGDLTMNSALSEYDQILKDVYGLFAMSKSPEELQKNIEVYFNNTINNTGILQGSDSYTRSFINSIGSLFSSGDISFDNIVDTQSDSFKLVTVPGSALGNPYVLERQIVEYMKYRGPVNIGKGLLTKLGVFGDTSKQTKALEAKIDYEKKLDTVQDACENAYEKINAFNSKVAGQTSASYKTSVTNTISTARSEYLKMTEYICATLSDNYKVSSLSVDDTLKSSVDSQTNALSGTDKNMQGYNLIKELIKPYIEPELQTNGSYKNKSTSTYKTKYDALAFGSGADFTAQKGYVTDIKTIYNDYKKVYTLIDRLTNAYNKLSSVEKDANSTEYDFIKSFYAGMNLQVNQVSTLHSEWKSKAKEYGKAGSKAINDKYKEIEGISSSLQSAISALDTVLDKVDDLSSARTNWGNKVDALSVGDIKTSMKGDYENSAKDINEASINSLKTVLTNNKSYFDAIKTRLDEIKYFDQKVNDSNFNSTDYYSRFQGKISNPSASASSIMDTNYANRDLNGIIPADYTVINESQQFYKYLKNVCSAVAGDSAEKQESKNLKKNLIEAGNDDKKGTVDLGSINTGSIGGLLPGDLSDLLSALATASDNSPNVFNPTDSDSGKKDKDIAQTNKDNMSIISIIIEGLGNIVVTARDKVYLEEYFTEMFSCYTSDRKTDGSVIADPKSLSNKSLNGNPFYKSEVEYILWGNDSAQANLNNTKGLIFGLRFALNSVYAFTSSDIRTPALTAATAIAGWTGFGVPIVQTVIILAWSMAESIVDVNALCEGKAVALYKNSTTWSLGINSIKNKVADAIVGLAAEAVTDIFEKVNEYTNETIDSVTSDINRYITQTEEGLVEAASSAIITPIEQFAMKIVGESNYNLTKPDISAQYDSMINSLKTSVSQESGISKAAKLAAIDAIPKDTVVNAIFDCYNQAKEGTIGSISTKIQTMLNTVADRLTTPIKNAVSEAGEWLKSEVSSITSEASDLAKEKVIDAIGQYTEKISGSLPSDGLAGADKTTSGSGITMTYKEYLKAFILLFSLNDGMKESMLTRTAKLIQVNLTNNTNPALKNPSFNMAKAYTMVEINATVSIRTTFFSVPIATVDASGNTSYELDFSLIGSDRQKIKYVGINGY